MKPSTKAACLSLFVFPGVGLLWLKRWARGLFFLIPALLIIVFIFYRIISVAKEVYAHFLRRVEEGYLVVDPTNILQVAMKIYQEIVAALGTETQKLQMLEYFFIACWLCSALSSYFVGLKIEKATSKSTTKSAS